MTEKEVVNAIKDFAKAKKYTVDRVFANEVAPGRYWVFLVSPSFNGKKREQLQDEIWKYIEPKYGMPALESISLVMTMTPEEAKISISEVAA